MALINPAAGIGTWCESLDAAPNTQIECKVIFIWRPCKYYDVCMEMQYTVQICAQMISGQAVRSQWRSWRWKCLRQDLTFATHQSLKNVLSYRHWTMYYPEVYWSTSFFLTACFIPQQISFIFTQLTKVVYYVLLFIKNNCHEYAL